MANNILIVGGSALIALALGVGGTFAVMTMTSHNGPKTAETRKPPAPIPLYFADVPDIVVSIPDVAGDPPSSFVQFGIQFQTSDAQSVDHFNTLEPIIKSRIMDLLMQQTGATLQTEATRTSIEQKSLSLVNTALETRNYAQKPPFTAAYITSLVVQD